MTAHNTSRTNTPTEQTLTRTIYDLARHRRSPRAE